MTCPITQGGHKRNRQQDGCQRVREFVMLVTGVRDIVESTESEFDIHSLECQLVDQERTRPVGHSDWLG